MFHKKIRCKKFCNTYRKTLAPESLRNKLAGPQACYFIKKTRQNRRPPPRPLPLRTMKSSRTLILKNTFERLPLIIHTLSIPFLFKISRKLSQSLKKIITIFEYYFQTAVDISHYKFDSFSVLY